MPEQSPLQPVNDEPSYAAEDELSNNRHVRFRTVKRIQDEYTYNEETDVIGSGAFSVVYRATPTSAALAQHRRSSAAPPPLPSAYALKIIPRNKETDTEKRMQHREVDREVCVLQKLSHSGCSAFVDALQTTDKYVIVMNLLDGCMDAGRFLKTFGPLSEAHAALVVYQLLATTQYLHRTFGLLHRDVKVENILLSPCPTSAVCSGGSSSGVGSGSLQLEEGNNSSVMTASVMPVTTPMVVSVEGDAGSSNKRQLAIAGREQGCAAQMGQVPPSTSEDGCIAPLSEDTAAMKHIRNFGKVTLVDFGLARWLPARQQQQTSSLPAQPSRTSSSTGGAVPLSPTPAAAGATDRCHTPPQCQSPVSPSGVPLFFATPPSLQPMEHTSSTTDAAAASSCNPILHIGCCGSDKYLAHEMLKWYVENCGGHRSGSGSGRRAVTAEQAMKLDVYAIGVVAYVLLSGCLPYNGKTKAMLAQQQATSALKMNSVHWIGISAEAKQFVASLLATDQSQRLTIEAALEHNWMMTPRVRCQKLHLTPEPLAAAHHHPSGSPSCPAGGGPTAVGVGNCTTAAADVMSGDASSRPTSAKKEDSTVDPVPLGHKSTACGLPAKVLANEVTLRVSDTNSTATHHRAKSSEDVHDLLPLQQQQQQQQHSASKSSMAALAHSATAVTPKKQCE